MQSCFWELIEVLKIERFVELRLIRDIVSFSEEKIAISASKRKGKKAPILIRQFVFRKWHAVWSSLNVNLRWERKSCFLTGSICFACGYPHDRFKTWFGPCGSDPNGPFFITTQEVPRSLLNPRSRLIHLFWQRISDIHINAKPYKHWLPVKKLSGSASVIRVTDHV